MAGYAQDIAGTRRAEILLVGNELLVGTTRDANAFWLGGELGKAGISVSRVTIIHDDVAEIAGVLREILGREPVYLFTSGGIGPTFDDETLAGIAEGLDRELRLDETALAWIRHRYDEGVKAGRIKDKEMTPSRIKMARLPAGSTPLFNSAGTAPGVRIVAGKTTIFVLPGVPRELQAIYTEAIAPTLDAGGGIMYHDDTFSVHGVGESAMASQVEAIMQASDPRVWIKSHAKHDGTSYYVEMHVSGFGDRQLGEQVFRTGRRIRELLRALGGTVDGEK